MPWLNGEPLQSMMTLRQLSAEPPTIPTRTSWYLTELAEARGKQELFTHQSPQKLKALREHALIESAVSSNRIEGVTVDQARIGRMMSIAPYTTSQYRTSAQVEKDISRDRNITSP